MVKPESTVDAVPRHSKQRYSAEPLRFSCLGDGRVLAIAPTSHSASAFREVDELIMSDSSWDGTSSRRYSYSSGLAGKDSFESSLEAGYDPSAEKNIALVANALERRYVDAPITNVFELQGDPCATLRKVSALTLKATIRAYFDIDNQTWKQWEKNTPSYALSAGGIVVQASVRESRRHQIGSRPEMISRTIREGPRDRTVGARPWHHASALSARTVPRKTLPVICATISP